MTNIQDQLRYTGRDNSLKQCAQIILQPISEETKATFANPTAKRSEKSAQCPTNSKLDIGSLPMSDAYNAFSRFPMLLRIA